MTKAGEQVINAGVVRRDYLDGLSAMTPDGARALHEPLTGHLRDLVPAVESRTPYMSARRREQAVHCLLRAAETLAQAPAPGAEIAHAYDLAVSARALLALYRSPFEPPD